MSTTQIRYLASHTSKLFRLSFQKPEEITPVSRSPCEHRMPNHPLQLTSIQTDRQTAWGASTPCRTSNCLISLPYSTSHWRFSDREMTVNVQTELILSETSLFPSILSKDNYAHINYVCNCWHSYDEAATNTWSEDQGPVCVFTCVVMDVHLIGHAFTHLRMQTHMTRLDN